MKLDEAKAITHEHNVLTKLAAAIREELAKSTEITNTYGTKTRRQASLYVEEERLIPLLPLIDARLVELAGNFEPEAPALTPPEEPKKRPKVRASVIEMWNSWATTPGNPEPLTEQAWRNWAAEKGFRWASVGNVLAELRAMSTPTAAPAAQPNEQ